MANLRQTPLTCSGHTRPVVDLDFSGVTSTGYFLISACKDGKPMLRQGDMGDWIGTFEGHKGAVWGVALNRDATYAATAAADFTCKLWDAITGDELHTFQQKHIVKTVNFSKNGRYLTCGGHEKVIRVYDLNDFDKEPLEFVGHQSAIKHVLFFRDDTHLISVADDRTLRVWDISTGMEIQQLEFSTIPNSLEVSRDGNVLTLTHANHVSFFDAESLSQIREYDLPTIVNSASLHKDKSIFVAGGDDLKVYKFDYLTGNEIESFKGHFGPVHCVKFSPDGELYASGSEDGTLRLWQTTVGKTYGLWKCFDGPQMNSETLLSQKEVQAM